MNLNLVNVNLHLHHCEKVSPPNFLEAEVICT